MCLSTTHLFWSAWHHFWPVKAMDGYKRLMKGPRGLTSPLYQIGEFWVEGQKRSSDGHGFYFFPSLGEARTMYPYTGSHDGSAFHRVRAYGVFRRGRQEDALVYMAREMELLPPDKT
jgi:hypothetical protein